MVFVDTSAPCAILARQARQHGSVRQAFFDLTAI